MWKLRAPRLAFWNASVASVGPFLSCNNPLEAEELAADAGGRCQTERQPVVGVEAAADVPGRHGGRKLAEQVIVRLVGDRHADRAGTRAFVVTMLAVAPSKNTPNFPPEIFAAVVAFDTEPPPDRNTPEPLLPEMVPAHTLSLGRPFP
jgi:hypothetical protein